MRKLCFLLILILISLAAFRMVRAQSGDVLVLEVEGPVTPAMASYFDRGIDTAEETEAAAVLIVLDTPGGAIDTTQEIVSRFRTATVPIIVYVGPRGAQAASAGSIITMAAHASGMAPETVIGAASPVGSEGEDLNETMFRKVTEDLKASVRSLTERRGEEAVALAEAMIEEARAVNATEALNAGLIDAVADDPADLLSKLDGLVVPVNDESVTLATATAAQRPFGMNALEQLLHAVANPLLVGILFAIGVQAILIELNTPGGWVAGFIGVVCLALALYGVGQLPVNWLGAGLVVVAFALFIAEVFTPTYGALALTGAITLVAGLLVLFNSPGTPEFARISVPGAIGISLATAAFFIFLLTKVVQASRQPSSTGKEGLLSEKGVVRRTFTSKLDEPPYQGTVLIHGELWQALADEPLAPGTPVRVTAVDGFTLHVAPITQPQLAEQV